MFSTGQTCVCVSEDWGKYGLMGMCDHIYVMKGGRLAGCFDREEVIQEKIRTVDLESKQEQTV